MNSVTPWNLRFSGKFRCVEWQFLTDVSRQPIGPILSSLRWDPGRLSREILTICCVISLKSADLFYFAAETWNHAKCYAFNPSWRSFERTATTVVIVWAFLDVEWERYKNTAYDQSRGPGSSVGIATGYGLDGPGIEKKNPGDGEIFRTCPDRPWGPHSLLYNGYRVIPGGKERQGCDADLSPPSSAAIRPLCHSRTQMHD